MSILLENLIAVIFGIPAVFTIFGVIFVIVVSAFASDQPDPYE